MTLRRTLIVIKPEMVDAKDVVTSLGAKFEKVEPIKEVISDKLGA
jgi:nucleoside diphosphate kinase